MSVRRGPRPVGERLRRLLLMLPWLMERREVSVADMARTFEVSESELVKDLEMASMCGLPPFIDEMVDVFIDEGMVFVGVPRLFTKPLRITAPEGFALLTAGRSALELPGADPDGALARALRKLAAVLGDDGVVVDTPQPPAAADVVAAATEGARLRITHWSGARDEASEREITPRAVFLDRGNWYVVADDHRSGEERTFRIDRIERWERTGAIDAPRDVRVPGGDDWFANSDLPEVVLRLDSSSSWVAERYPVAQRVDEEGSGGDGSADGGSVQITLRVTSERWLRALLLRLGPHATVLEPPRWRNLGAEAAAELLAAYDTSDS